MLSANGRPITRDQLGCRLAAGNSKLCWLTWWQLVLATTKVTRCLVAMINDLFRIRQRTMFENYPIQKSKKFTLKWRPKY